MISITAVFYNTCLLSEAFSLVSYTRVIMTPVEIKAAQRISAALLKQSREKMRDAAQHKATKED